MLFNIMINDIFSQVEQGVGKSLYADDGALWTVTDDLQHGIDKIQDAHFSVASWSHTCGLQISITKTNAMWSSMHVVHA